MNAQVYYLPGYRVVSEQEMVARMMLQDHLSLFHIEFDQANRDLNDYQYFLKKDELHHKLRQSITVLSRGD